MRAAGPRTSLPLIDTARTYLLKAKVDWRKPGIPRMHSPAFLQTLVGLEEAEGNYRLALEYHKRVTAINDSLFSQDKKNEIAGLEGKHDLALKDKELALERLTTSTQRRTSIGLLIGVILLAVIGILLYRQSRQRKIVNVQLAEANQVKARFFAILSHDLRAPIVNLLHFLHILQRGAGPADRSGPGKQSQQEIGDSVETLLGTMESMLLWSKEQMESFHPTIRPTGSGGAVRLSAPVLWGSRMGSRLICDGAERPLPGATDEHYLRTIMQNLTSNALRVLRGQPDAKGGMERAANTGGFIPCCPLPITGPDLSPGQAAALKADAAAENAPTGFGFHLIRDLAKAIDCAVEAESEPGKGTVFHLRLKDTVLLPVK
jgi:signal transduction histidine kinase